MAKPVSECAECGDEEHGLAALAWEVAVVDQGDSGVVSRAFVQRPC
jgi:hypothetical protein